MDDYNQFGTTKKPNTFAEVLGQKIVIAEIDQTGQFGSRRLTLGATAVGSTYQTILQASSNSS